MLWDAVTDTSGTTLVSVLSNEVITSALETLEGCTDSVARDFLRIRKDFGEKMQTIVTEWKKIK